NDDALRQQGGVATLHLQARAVLAVGRCEGERLCGSRKPRAKTISLNLRGVSQLAAADAGGKAEKILDQRRGSGLSTRCVAFQNHSFETFGGGINRGGETSRTGADEGELGRDVALPPR